MSEVKENFGVVVLLDALGAQSATIQESVDFVDFLKHSSEGVSLYLDSFTKDDDNELRKHFDEIKPTTRTFGDTFLITWTTPSDKNVFSYIAALSTTVSDIIVDGIENGVLFRGAVGIGSFLESETTIIGPAINDVASWYEQANWFGCITTPNCTQRLNAEIDASTDNSDFIKYNVPLKSKEQIELWCMDWPQVISTFTESDPLKWYYQCVSKLNIPIGTEKKYYNSEEFLKYCLKNA